MMSKMTLGLDRVWGVITRAGMTLGVICLLVSAVQAQTPVMPPGGGTSANPYQISQLGHLVWMTDRSAWSDIPRYYKFTKDIDASVTASWNGGAGFTPIDAYLNLMGSSGVIDGNGKVIRNLTIKPSFDKVGVGFFANLDMGWEVKNLGLVGLVVAGGYNMVGGLVGWTVVPLAGAT